MKDDDKAALDKAAVDLTKLVVVAPGAVPRRQLPASAALFAPPWYHRRDA